MKVDTNLKAILILVIFIGNVIITDCKVIKSSYHRHKKLSARRHSMKRTVTQNFLFEKLKEIATDPENILYFALGAMSIFNSSYESFYKSVKTIIEHLKPCVDAAKGIYLKLNDAKDAIDLNHLKKNDAIKKVESDFLTKDNKQEYCELVQNEIQDTFMEATKEGYGNSDDWKSIYNHIPALPLVTYWVSSKVVAKENKCERIYMHAPKTQKKIKEKFGSLREYEYQCLFFSSVNCNDFNPETKGIWNFILKAYEYYSLIDTTKTCLVNLFTAAKPQDPVRTIFEQSGLNDAIASVVGFAANIFTFGAWGGIKGGYYLIQLGLDIAYAYQLATEDLPFKIGQMFGKAIMIAKSLITGKRKIKRKFK